MPTFPVFLLKKGGGRITPPCAYDNDLRYAYLTQLLARRAVPLPQHGYKNYLRPKTTVRQESADVIILEGILALYDERIRNLPDIRYRCRFALYPADDARYSGTRPPGGIGGGAIHRPSPPHAQPVCLTQQTLRAHDFPCDEQNNVAVEVLIAKIEAVLQGRR